MAIFIRRKGKVFNFKKSVPTVKHDGENSFSGLDIKKVQEALRRLKLGPQTYSKPVYKSQLC